MDLCRAVFLMEEDASIPVDGKPLMLEAILGRPILERAAKQCMADGVQRFFVVCPPRFVKEAAACFPEGTDVTFSEQHAQLLDFLDNDENTLFSAAPPCPLHRRVRDLPMLPPAMSCGAYGRKR